MRFLIIIVSMTSWWVFLGCANLYSKNELMPPGGWSPQKASIDEAVLELRWPEGTRYMVDYHFRSEASKWRSGDQAAEKRVTPYSFRVITEVLGAEYDKLKLKIDTEWIDKSDSAASLGEFGYPEPGETLKVEVDRMGQVLSVEGKLSGSLYYVPQFFLPDRSVKPGDTWLGRAQWNSAQGMSFNLNVVNILREFKMCGERPCALIVMSGEVHSDEDGGAFHLSSEVRGALLVDIEEGAYLWSRLLSNEELIGPETTQVTLSCFEGVDSEFARTAEIDVEILCP